jgi:hypothetical protein
VVHRKGERREPADLERFYPALIIPNGLTFDDLKRAARHIAEYEREDGEAIDHVELVTRIYVELRAEEKAK